MSMTSSQRHYSKAVFQLREIFKGLLSPAVMHRGQTTESLTTKQPFLCEMMIREEIRIHRVIYCWLKVVFKCFPTLRFLHRGNSVLGPRDRNSTHVNSKIVTKNSYLITLFKCRIGI